MDRAGWQQLAEDRVVDAKALLDACRWPFAYYAAGYAVECALKSCVLARVGAAPELIFQDRKFGDRCWTHSLKDLLEVAGVKAAFEVDLAANPDLNANWKVVKDWSEVSRYGNATRAKAEELYSAITDSTNGVLSWSKARW